ncbi:MAG: cell wall metabolism sensor histidine kinase WalK [Nanoarchaeota archaeon]|nr:cell wall metabolism sensor histidine kinase WalK [Nanoarchaeota archaeon]
MYVGRVWVINHWANAVYLPLKNFKGHIIGAIGFESPEENLREAKFLLATGDIQQIILYATILIVLASIMVTYIIANKLTKPLHELSKSMQEVNQGNLEQGVKIKSYDEINELAKTFNIMVRYLRKQIIKREQEIIKEYQEKTKRKKGN